MRDTTDAKHTPGPWHVSVFDGTTVYSGQMHTGVAACAPDPLPPPHIRGGTHFAPPDDLEERKANAHLISAVLELLAVAEQAVNDCFTCAGQGITPDNDDCPDCKSIREAIRKARGQ